MSSIMSNNPRKELRKHINHLLMEKSKLDKRSRLFQNKIDELSAMELSGYVEDCKREAESFDRLNWLAFPNLV